MTNPEEAPLFPALTAEYIATHTGYQLVATYPADTHNNPVANRDFLAHTSALESEYRKVNVASSWFVDEEGQVKLGIFVRPLSERPFQPDTTRYTAADNKGRVALWSIMNTRDRNDHM